VALVAGFGGLFGALHRQRPSPPPDSMMMAPFQPEIAPAQPSPPSTPVPVPEMAIQVGPASGASAATATETRKKQQHKGPVRRRRNR